MRKIRPTPVLRREALGSNGEARGERATRRIVLAALLVVAGLASGTGATQEPVNPANEARKGRLALYGGGASHVGARALGVSEIMGKPVGTQPPSPKPLNAQAVEKPTLAIAKRDEPSKASANVPIREFPNVSENEPTVVANPRDPSRLVAGTHFIGDTGNRCIAHNSRNGGKTWNLRPIFMPQLTHQSQCSDPVLAYAPDGSRVYYAYMDIKASHFDILVSYSDDDGATWKGPIVALSNPVADYDKPWIGTHVPVVSDDDDREDDDRRQSNARWVYISATRFAHEGPCHIDFARSADMGTTWSSPHTLDTSGGFCGEPIVVQGSRPNGGVGGDVLVAWYHSGVDGWLNGSFQVRTRFSSNNGAAFGPITVAATDSFELPFWLGPSANYHRWWLAMFPDVEIAPDGSAHILYTHDPDPGSATAEDGDIRYLRSARPYTAWSHPTTANDDGSGKAQGLATLEASVHRGRTVLYAIWEDHRESPSDNFKYGVFWSKKEGNGPWDRNERLTTAQSTSDFVFVGDYYDVTVARGRGDKDNDGNGDSNGLFVYAVWTDRRDEPTPFDFDDDVWGARIPPVSRQDDN